MGLSMFETIRKSAKGLAWPTQHMFSGASVVADWKLLAGLNPSLQRRLNMFDKKRYMHSMREREREHDCD
jgi:hypothetical protein